MEIRFFCESAALSASNGGISLSNDIVREPASQFVLRGLASVHVDDDYGPPAEWNYLTTGQISTIERTPLTATVQVETEEAWPSIYTGAVEGYVDKSRLVNDEGKAISADDFFGVSRAVHASALDSDAIVHYNAPWKERDFPHNGRDDARLQILLRVKPNALEEWHHFCRDGLSRGTPPCTVTLWGVGFSDREHARIEGASPTWRRFVAGHFPAVAGMGYTWQAERSWDRLVYER